MRPLKLLSELDPNPPRMRIPGLLTLSGNVLISAYRKAGKTTLILSLINALTSDDSFLGRDCSALSGPVVYVNLELDENMLRQYCTELGMDLYNKHAVFQDYKGYGSEFTIREDGFREDYAKMLLDLGAKALIIDPLHPLFVHAAAESNNNDEARLIMEHLGEIRSMAELDHLFVVDHTGHLAKNRARGASGKEDWADVLWNVTGQYEQPRVLVAEGRGVMGGCTYLMVDGRLVEVDEDGDATPAGSKIRTALAEAGRPMTSTQIQFATMLSQPTVSRELNKLAELGNIERTGDKDSGQERWYIKGSF